MIGHSGGAQAAIAFIASKNPAVSALVSLDTTQDYYSLLDNRWHWMTSAALKHPENFAMPMMVAAKPPAIFQLFDALRSAPRYYVTARNLSHNEFILAKRGIAATLSVLERFHRDDPSNPIYDPVFAFSLVYELLERGKRAEAVVLYRLYSDFARSCLEKAVLLEPRNTEAQKKLNELNRLR